MTSLEAVRLVVDKVLGQEVHLLWREQKMEEDFVKSLLKVGFDLLQHNQLNKASEMKGVLFDLLQQTMERYGSEIKYMSSNINQKIIDLLYN